MLRAASSIYVESQALELLFSARRDVFKRLRGSSLCSQAAPGAQTVLTASRGAAPTPAPAPAGPTPPPPPSPPPGPESRGAWRAAAAALAVTASIGGVYYYRKLKGQPEEAPAGAAGAALVPDGGEGEAPPYPASGEQFPAHVQYLLVGAGTASFAAMRAIRSARPDAQVLMVGEERDLPYMRPPLSKELWRESELEEEPAALTFRQWNGRRRSLVYEPPAFYAPLERFAQGGGGAAVARGWRVERIDPVRHEAELSAGGAERALITYDKCLVATGVRARRSAALRGAAAAGRALTLRSVRDAQRLARDLQRKDVTRVAVLGGGLLAAELSAALADRLRGEGRAVVQLYREEAPLAGLLPRYLAEDAARRLADCGVTLLSEAEVVSCEVPERGVRLRLASGDAVEADLVVECIGAEVDEALAQRSQLETHPELGGVLVNAELQARADLYAAGDVACFYDVALGRRRVEHHDHAVVSGRLAGENMAAVAPPKHYAHQSMFWSDLGPQLGYEAIGIIDSRLPTVSVFSADAVSAEGRALSAGAAGAQAQAQADAGGAQAQSPARRYERGVVFYVRAGRVVGVLLWNLFNRMHVARQVLAHGEYEDLFEVAKLFSLHEDE